MGDQRVAGAVVAAGGAHGLAGAVLLTATCAAGIYRAAAAGDVATVSFVIVSCGAFLLLLSFLRAYEVAPAEAAVRREGLRRRVWALCTLLTAMMFAWKVAGVMPWPVAVGAWAAAAVTCSAGGFVLHFRQQRPGGGFDGQYAELQLLKMGFGVAACDSALAHHHAHGGAGSLALVFVAFVGFVTLTWPALPSSLRFDGRRAVRQ